MATSSVTGASSSIAGGSSAGGISSHHSNIFVFAVVGKGDMPLYEADLSSSSRGGAREDTPHLDQFIIHTALDMVDEAVWQRSSNYLKVIDQFNDFLVSAYVTPSHIKLLLLHRPRRDDAKRDEAIRDFFLEVHELYTKTLMNPFYAANGLITSHSFDARVRKAAKVHLTNDLTSHTNKQRAS